MYRIPHVNSMKKVKSVATINNVANGREDTAPLCEATSSCEAAYSRVVTSIDQNTYFEAASSCKAPTFYEETIIL